MALRWGSKSTGPYSRPPRAKEAHAALVRLLADLRTRSGNGGPFLCGDQFGIVDAMYAPVCVRFRGYGVTLDATATARLRADAAA